MYFLERPSFNIHRCAVQTLKGTFSVSIPTQSQECHFVTLWDKNGLRTPKKYRNWRHVEGNGEGKRSLQEVVVLEGSCGVKGGSNRGILTVERESRRERRREHVYLF